MKQSRVIFLLAVFLISCNQKVARDDANLQTPTVSPTLNELQTKLIELDTAARDRLKEEQQKDLKEYAQYLSRRAKLSDLEHLNLPQDDLEVRLWRDFGILFQRKVIVIGRTKNVWSAKLITEKTANQDDIKGAIINLKTINLHSPKSGWEDLWQKLVDENLLTLPNGEDVGTEPYADNWSYLVETKVKGTYRIYLYEEGFEEKIKEARQMANVANIVAEEFSLNDFKAEKYKE